MVQAASYPPLQRTQGRGTQSSGTGKVKGETESRATRPTVQIMNGACMLLVNEDGGFATAFRVQLLLLALSPAIFASGCHSTETIWSAQAKSPDGKVVASAQADLRNKGLSIISGIDTNVYVNWAGDKRPPMLVLNLADGSDAPSDITVDMRWLAPTHLELTYKGNRSIGFQALKWAGIDISVRDLSNAASGGSR